MIATEEGDLSAEVMWITEGKGARVVFDPVGGPDFAKLVSALGVGGRIYLYGALSLEPTTLPMLAMIAKMPTIKGHNLWGTTGDTVRRRAAVEYVRQGLERGTLLPMIDRVFAFDDMVDAHRYLEGNGQFGKVVVTL